MIQYSTLWYSTVWYSTVQCDTVQYSVIQYTTSTTSVRAKDMLKCKMSLIPICCISRTVIDTDTYLVSNYSQCPTFYSHLIHLWDLKSMHVELWRKTHISRRTSWIYGPPSWIFFWPQDFIKRATPKEYVCQFWCLYPQVNDSPAILHLSAPL